MILHSLHEMAQTNSMRFIIYYQKLVILLKRTRKYDIYLRVFCKCMIFDIVVVGAPLSRET